MIRVEDFEDCARHSATESSTHRSTRFIGRKSYGACLHPSKRCPSQLPKNELESFHFPGRISIQEKNHGPSSFPYSDGTTRSPTVSGCWKQPAGAIEKTAEDSDEKRMGVRRSDQSRLPLFTLPRALRSWP